MTERGVVSDRYKDWEREIERTEECVCVCERETDKRETSKERQ